MLLTSPLLSLSSSLKPYLNLTLAHPSSFITPQNALPIPLPCLPKMPLPASSAPSSFSVLAMKKLQGRVVKNASDKTVAVEVVRLAPHPKYHRRVRIKKRYQAHDPENTFKVGDFVELEKVRPISKTKTFLAVPVTAKNVPKAADAVPAELRELPALQSQDDAQ